MFEYVKINNISTMKLYNNNFKLITIWRKVTRLGISFLNQPFFLVFDPSNDEVHQRSCQGAWVMGASRGIQIQLMIYYYEFLEKFLRLDTLVINHPRNLLFSSPTNWRFGNGISDPYMVIRSYLQEIRYIVAIKHLFVLLLYNFCFFVFQGFIRKLGYDICNF